MQGQPVDTQILGTRIVRVKLLVKGAARSRKGRVRSRDVLSFGDRIRSYLYTFFELGISFYGHIKGVCTVYVRYNYNIHDKGLGEHAGTSIPIIETI